MTETQEGERIAETTVMDPQTQTTSMDICADTIEETPPEELPAIVRTDEVDDEEQSTSSAEQIETTVEDCEVLYGVIMETAHGMVGTKKGKGHRGLPESRRKAQGRLLHSICLKYNITIPTEFELVIFGGALIADWQFMGAVEADENESTCIVEEEEEAE